MIYNNLDIDLLRTLEVATDLGAFVKAASHLGRSQSALSLQMKKLEELVGRPIFKKQGRGIVLTDVGDVLLGYARRILALNDEALSVARGIATSSFLRLGLPHELAERWLASVLRMFHQAHPSVQLEAHIGRGRDLREKAALGEIDLALSFGAIGLSSWTPDILAQFPMVWIAAKNFSIDPSRPLPLALLAAPCLFRQHAMDSLDQVGRSWRITFTSPSLTGLWGAVEAGLGLTLRSRIGVPSCLVELDPVRMGLPQLSTVPLSLCRSPNGGAPARDVLQSILVELLLHNPPEGLNPLPRTAA